jgi:hypothetical protein
MHKRRSEPIIDTHQKILKSLEAVPPVSCPDSVIDIS